jgi:hypothetical protein
MFATIASGTSIRRDVRMGWEIDVRNRSNEPLGAIELPLVGEVPVSGEDLAVSGRTGDRAIALEAHVDHCDGISPIVTISPPAPGLAPGGTLCLAFGYEWPAMAHVRSDCWVIDLLHVEDGGIVVVELTFPEPDAQFADLHIVRARLGRRSDQPMGRLEPRADGGRSLLEFRYVKQHGDELLTMWTKPVGAGYRQDVERAVGL